MNYNEVDEQIHAAMKEWLLDCFNDEYDQEQIKELNYNDTIGSINRYYDGGVRAFIKDTKPLWK